MQSNDVIEVVTPLGVGAAKLPYSRMWLPFLRALRVYWWSRVAVRHLSSVESPVAPFLRRVEIPVIGERSESGDQRMPPGRPGAPIHGIASDVATAEGWRRDARTGSCRSRRP
jgi:hypothetical protein